ncbi:pentapeptide repeat-containing protein [Methylocapsa palsarum]|uniref:Uncharacterized protein YjbI, contains pentapeptide repeats n=1 Tax=Methylocapsa palsarum TaxID=1612308 RepID=A0A1I4B1I1_9HYPH|nr:pentapeptide repeat-containing protein [Methylocapsa palsarum]SFK62708.1 Uncharacterized protein YjbI, contains pentapeptide repeats [Methylocapsa palsarum]
MRSKKRSSRLASAVFALAFAAPVCAQDMMRNVDLSGPQFTRAEMTREEVAAGADAARKRGTPADFSGKSLNGLDLSGLDLNGVNFRAARMNKAKLVGAKLDGAVLDQVWAMASDFSGASLKGAALFASQMQDAKFDGADLTGARITADFSRSSFHKAKFKDANLSADMKNQSMGLMRGVLKSADARDADFEGANMAQTDLQFANFSGANFTGASLMGADAGGADFRGAALGGANLDDLDVTSARIDLAQEKALARAKNASRAFRE